MNYLQQILAFNDYLLYEQRLSSGQISLWHALMAIDNKTAWAEWFTAANVTLESLSGLSRTGVQKARNVLKQLGLIEFSPNGRNKATSYKLKPLYMSDSGQQSNQQRVTEETSKESQEGQNRVPLNKLNETKQNKDDDDARANVIDLWTDLWGFPNAIARPELDELIDAVGAELVAYAIQIAGEHQVKSYGALKYLQTVVDGWQKLKVTTLEQAKQANKEHEQQRKSNQRSPRSAPVTAEPKTRKDWIGE